MNEKVIGAAIGGASAFAADGLLKRRVPRQRIRAHALLLIGVIAARSQARIAAPMAAAGWAAHAVFDLLHDRGPDSYIPSWYPALCAGYDISLAALLITGAEKALISD
jgi:hypothetical protein